MTNVVEQLREDAGSRPATLVHVFDDFVLMTTALIMLSRSRPGDRPSRGLLACGILIISAADIGEWGQTMSWPLVAVNMTLDAWDRSLRERRGAGR